MFGNRMKDLRKERDITQEEMANKLGVHITTINRIERGTMDPPMKIAIGIANILGCTIDWLVNGK